MCQKFALFLSFSNPLFREGETSCNGGDGSWILPHTRVIKHRQIIELRKSPYVKLQIKLFFVCLDPVTSFISLLDILNM